MKKEISQPAAIAIAAVVAVLVLVFGFYIINREPPGPSNKGGEGAMPSMRVPPPGQRGNGN